MEFDGYGDPLFEQAVKFVVEKQSASIVSIQRQFTIGYNRASCLVERMESFSLVGQQDDNGQRPVLFTDIHSWLAHRNHIENQPTDMTNVILWPYTQDKDN